MKSTKIVAERANEVWAEIQPLGALPTHTYFQVLLAQPEMVCSYIPLSTLPAQSASSWLALMSELGTW